MRRIWVWWNARLDARLDLPSREARALGDSEEQIRSAVNLSIRDAEESFGRRARPRESKLAAIRQRVEDIYQPEFERLAQKIGRREVQVHMSRFGHWILLALLTLGEMAFNLVAFNIFREPALQTALMALAVVLAIPLCALAVGVWVRQWPQPWWGTLIKLMVLLATLAAVLVGINRVRLAYLRELAPGFVDNHPELTWAFFVVNVVVLVGAALVTYLAHDPEPGFAEIKRKLEYARRKEHAIEGRLNVLRTRLVWSSEFAKEAGWQLMAYYRTVNRRRRTSPVPKYFDDENDHNHRPVFISPDCDKKETEPIRVFARKEVFAPCADD